MSERYDAYGTYQGEEPSSALGKLFKGIAYLTGLGLLLHMLAFLWVGPLWLLSLILKAL